MKLSSLLARRRFLLRQAHLANLAFAFERLSDLTWLVARAQLAGEVRLQQAAPEAERYSASLTALEGSQSVIEEHFTDEDLMDLADVVAFVIGEHDIDLTFRIEELGERFLVPLRAQLERAGIAIDQDGSIIEESSREGPAGRSCAGEGG
jgi:hypothetical protein